MGSLDVLTTQECLTLLGARAVGRVALTHRALPVVLPVSYVLEGRDLLLRTHPGSALAAGRDGVVVAFETDNIDDVARTGWTVLVVGMMRELTGAQELVHAQQLDLIAWPGEDRSSLVRITSAQITGRRLLPQANPNAWASSRNSSRTDG